MCTALEELSHTELRSTFSHLAGDLLWHVVTVACAWQQGSLMGLCGVQAKPLPQRGDVLKVVHAVASGWQTARPPYEVQFRCCLAPLRTPVALPADVEKQWSSCQVVLGQGQLPAEVETAVQSMPEGEAATFILPQQYLTASAEPGSSALPTVPDGEQGLCMMHVQMQAFVEVRDMAGDGKVCRPAPACALPCLPGPTTAGMLLHRPRSCTNLVP